MPGSNKNTKQTNLYFPGLAKTAIKEYDKFNGFYLNGSRGSSFSKILRKSADRLLGKIILHHAAIRALHRLSKKDREDLFKVYQCFFKHYEEKCFPEKGQGTAYLCATKAYIAIFRAVVERCCPDFHYSIEQEVDYRESTILSGCVAAALYQLGKHGLLIPGNLEALIAYRNIGIFILLNNDFFRAAGLLTQDNLDKLLQLPSKDNFLCTRKARQLVWGYNGRGDYKQPPACYQLTQALFDQLIEFAQCVDAEERIREYLKEKELLGEENQGEKAKAQHSTQHAYKGVFTDSKRYFSILDLELTDVSKDGFKKKVRQSYLDKIRVAHPDKNGKEEDAKQLNQAYSVLSDAEQCAAYVKAETANEGGNHYRK